MTFEEQCGYKYLLNSASIGYANKFKSLLLCGFRPWARRMTKQQS